MIIRDAVGKHEAMFTKRFSEMGFKWDVYADMGEEYNNHLFYVPQER